MRLEISSPVYGMFLIATLSLMPFLNSTLVLVLTILPITLSPSGILPRAKISASYLITANLIVIVTSPDMVKLTLPAVSFLLRSAVVTAAFASPSADTT